MNKFLLVFLLSFLQTACSKQVGQSPFPSPSLTQAPSNTIPAKASDTPMPINTYPPTNTPTTTPTIDPCSQAVCSPDGRYVAKLWYGVGSSPVERIEISERDGTILWTIPSELEAPDGEPYPSLTIYRWSKDSSILYFCYSSQPDGGDSAFWWDGFDLRGIEVATGNIQPVLPGPGYMSFAFSPDETRLAYALPWADADVIFIRDLSTGAQKNALIERGPRASFAIGDIRWSPSGEELAFQIEKPEHWIQTFYLNVTTMQLKQIKEYNFLTWEFDGWTDDEKLKFRGEGGIIIIDPQTGESIPTSTVTPMKTANNNSYY